ncbi:MAG: hypothetical protein V2A70_10020 [Candidatus Omnitrophota bacterium]
MNGMKNPCYIFCSVIFLTGLSCFSGPGLVVAADEVSLVYDVHGARDPFLPLVTSAGTIITYDTNLLVAEMALEGIVEGSGSRVAIINGNLMEVGQMIGLYKVVQIESDGVILLKDGQTSVLQLKKEE